MTDSIPTPANVVEIKARQKPGPKPKAQVPTPAPAAPEKPAQAAPVTFERVVPPMHGGFNPEAARDDFAVKAARWQNWNEVRQEDGVLGQDGILIELAYRAASTGSYGDVENLMQAAERALEVAE